MTLIEPGISPPTPSAPNTPSVPVLPPGPPPPTTPIDPLLGSIDAATRSEAANQLNDLVAQLQTQIDALSYISTEQGNQISRLTAAVNGLDCPHGIEDNATKEEVPASVKICVAQGTCTCDTGLALQMPFTDESSEPWSETPPPEQ